MSDIPAGLRYRLDQEGRTCQVCGGLGYVLPSNLPPTDSRYHTPIPCPACTDPAATRQRKWAALERKFGACWLHNSSKLREFSLEDFLRLPQELLHGKMAALKAAFLWAEQRELTYSDLLLPDPTSIGHSSYHSLVLCGLSDMGKSHLAAAAFFKRIEQEVGLAITYESLVRCIQAGYSDGTSDELQMAASQVPVLFVDDLGNAGYGTEKEDRSRIIFQIINHRYNHGLPTLVTTNLSQEGMALQFDYKTMRRLSGSAVWLTVSGQSFGSQGEQHG